MASCADSLNEVSTEERSQYINKKEIDLTRKIGDNVYDALGYSYEITENYINYKSVKNPVINIESYQNDSSTGGIIEATLSNVIFDYVYETSAESYSKALSVKLGIETEFGAFSCSLSSLYENSSDFGYFGVTMPVISVL
jgi:hypothetical protein